MSFAALWKHLPPEPPALSKRVRDLGSALPTHHFLLYHRYGYRDFEAVDQRPKVELLREGAWTGTGLPGAFFERETEDYGFYLEVCEKMELGTPLSAEQYARTFIYRQCEAGAYLRSDPEPCGLLILSNLLHLCPTGSQARQLWKAAIRGVVPGGFVYLVTASQHHAYARVSGRFAAPDSWIAEQTRDMDCLHDEKERGLHIGLYRIRSAQNGR